MIFNFFKNKNGQYINPATDDTLAGVKSQTDLLTFNTSTGQTDLNIDIASVASGGIDFGLQNASNVTINPATEDTLASVKTQFQNINFDPANGLKTTGVAPTLSSVLNVKDTTTNNINPASDEATYLWRRMVKMMESKAVVDAGKLKRVTIDSFGTDNVTGIGSLTTVGVSGSGVPMVTIANDFSANLTGLFTSTSFVGYNDQMYQDVARNAYAQNIRSKLIFS